MRLTETVLPFTKAASISRMRYHEIILVYLFKLASDCTFVHEDSVFKYGSETQACYKMLSHYASS